MSNGDVHRMYGVFIDGQLQIVRWTKENALAAVSKIINQNKIVRPVYVLTTNIDSLLLSQAMGLLSDAIEHLGQCKQKETRAINDCKREKSTIPNHYWEERYHAEMKVEALRRVVANLEQNINTGKFSSGA